MSAAQPKGMLPKALESSLSASDPVLRAQQEAKLRQAARLFESQFIATLFKEMRKSLPKGGVLNGGYGEQIFTGLLDQARSDSLAQTGSLGIASMLEQQLGRPRAKTAGDALRAGAYNLKPPANLYRAAGKAAPAGQAEAAPAEPVQETPAQIAPLLEESGQPLLDLEPVVQAPARERAPAPEQRTSVTLPMPETDEEESAETIMREEPRPSASPAPALGGKTAAEMSVPVQGAVTSTFGLRLHPITGDVRPHHGLDLAAPAGTPVSAALAGVVRFAGQAGDYGRLVVLEHDDGTSTFYGHCRSLSVTPGQRVAQGQMVARVGMTGLATGPHLHFEVRDAAGRPQDPLPMVAKSLNTSS